MAHGVHSHVLYENPLPLSGVTRGRDDDEDPISNRGVGTNRLFARTGGVPR